jgi:uncharacterized protein YggE
MAMAQPPVNGPNHDAMPPMSSIQPETTITLTGKGTVDHAPDVAMISVGVTGRGQDRRRSDAAASRAHEWGVFAAVKAAASLIATCRRDSFLAERCL